MTTEGTQPDTTDYVLTADLLFDGEHVHENHAIAIAGDRIAAVGPIADLRDHGEVSKLDGTLLPGFIDLHAHVHLDQTPRDIVLRHGLTTVRDTGGPLVPMAGGDGRLRVLGSGPILTAPGGYPVPVFGPQAAIEVADADAAREAVRALAVGGAVMVKIGLEPGGSGGAPWSAHAASSEPPWPLLPVETVAAIVAEAHEHGLTVAAHLSGPAGAEVALAAGVDEWAHVPCDPLPDELIEKAAGAGVRVVGTLATLSRTSGLFPNAIRMAQAGIRLLYGTDLAHPDVPWGISGFELQLMLHTGHGAVTPTEVLAAATARAGDHLGLAPLGRLVPGAPADVIGTRGDALARFKLLEYPSLVVSGGVVVVDTRD
ncbi:amidohydrolase family protein [Catenulispora yoronensis]|uniref:Amidohydrolase family protein n=1 Tax=Catenulispora yoronensis TaxID=450799 RepID=A0ABN2UDN4_9ACTN